MKPAPVVVVSWDHSCLCSAWSRSTKRCNRGVLQSGFSCDVSFSTFIMNLYLSVAHRVVVVSGLARFGRRVVLRVV